VTGSRLRVEAIGVTGLGEVTDGDDLAAALVSALADAGEPLTDGDLLVISSKVVSKAEGRVLAAPGREAAIDAETVRVVAERTGSRGVTRVVQARSGPVLAAAGVDASNVSPGLVLLLPEDPDASARALRARLRELTGARVGVVVSDTAGRPWRDGQVDLAIGAAGVAVVDDLRGATDPYGNPLEVTVRAVADELAAAADLVKGKLDGVPAAVVRGLAGMVTDDDGPGAAGLLRTGAGDWFRLGHVEAVRTALGVPPGTKTVTAPPLVRGAAITRLRAALDVALAGPDLIERSERIEPWVVAVLSEEFTLGMARLLGPSAPDSVALVSGEDSEREQVTMAILVAAGTRTASADGGPASPGPRELADTLSFGAFVQRVITAAWAEDLDARATLRPDGAVLVVAVITPSP
jgi:coenzyme F420-0:L-glutamate ligase/coenzyme F420-1:gamma-L-glutamate ligase